jgi:hypothetical protein
MGCKTANMAPVNKITRFQLDAYVNKQNLHIWVTKLPNAREEVISVAIYSASIADRRFSEQLP